VRIDYSFVRRASLGLLSWKDRKEKKERQKDKRLIFFFFFLFFFLFNRVRCRRHSPRAGGGLVESESLKCPILNRQNGGKRPRYAPWPHFFSFARKPISGHRPALRRMCKV
jgi:hypothetical protein